MIQHQGQHPPEDRKKEGAAGRVAGEGRSSWGRGKRLPWGGIVFALNQKNFNQSCNIEATLGEGSVSCH